MAGNGGARVARGLVVLLGGALLSAAPSGTPAQADPTTLEIIAVDTSVPGRVSATVRTDADTVRAALRRSSGTNLDSDVGTFAVTDGEAVVDVETWGMRTSLSYLLALTACPSGSTQTGCMTASAPFVPTDVAPDVVFSQDDTITGTEQATAHVRDEGGGVLRAYYRGPFTGQPLHEGAQVLRLDHGSNQVVVARCDGNLGCNYFGIAKTYTVDKGYAVGDETWSAVLPDDTTAPDATATFNVADTVRYSFRGHLLPSVHAAPEGWPAVVAQDLVPVDGRISLPLDLSSLPHGGHVLVGELSRTTTAGQVVQWAHARPPSVDREGPRFQFGSIGAEVFHPARDGHLDEVDLSANYYEPRSAQATLTVRHDETGTRLEVGTASGDTGEVSVTWDGRTADGRLAPAGTWEVLFTGVDQLGHRTEALVGELRLTHRRAVQIREVLTVSAQASLTDTTTHRCARIVRDPGNWRGGLGYRTGPCSNRADAFTRHESAAMPRGWLGGTVSVAGRGRSAEHRPNRLPREARLSFTSVRRAPSEKMLSPVGWYATRPVAYRRAHFDGVLTWVVGVDSATRYDVEKFRIIFEGTALR